MRVRDRVLNIVRAKLRRLSSTADSGERETRARVSLPDEDTVPALELGRDAELAACYEILEVSPETSDHEIKLAYWRVCKKYHPDRFDSDLRKKEISNDLFQRISAAYQQIRASRMR